MTDAPSQNSTVRAGVTPMVLAEGVSKSFGSNEVLKSISLSVRPGEVLCIIGPSGSGKSTFLRCINHLERVDAGRLSVDGQVVGYRQHGDKLYELKPKEASRQRREIGMVFQRFNLFPHMTALENIIEAPIRVKGLPKARAVERANELLVRVGLADKGDHYPSQLSGGQQQRVAIARALPGLPASDALHLDRCLHDVLEGRHVREQVEALEHHADVAALLRGILRVQLVQLAGGLPVADQLAVDVELAAVDLLQVVDAAQEGRLARPGRPDQAHHLAAPDGQRDALEHLQRAELLAHLLAAHHQVGTSHLSHQKCPEAAWAFANACNCLADILREAPRAK